GDHDQVPAVAHGAAQRLHQRGLAGPDRATDADAERPMGGWFGHDRNSLVYWVSCRMEHQSTIGVAEPRSSRSAASATRAAASTAGSSAAWMRSPSVWPSGTRRTAADTRLAANAWR